MVKRDMKIKSIKWNGRVEVVSFNGSVTGSKFVTDEAIVEPYGKERVDKIEEINLNTYEIHYIKYGGHTKVRIFNPIEVLFKQNINI